MSDDTKTNEKTQTDETEALGDKGKKALEAERRARRDAEKALRDAQARISEMEKSDLVRDVAAEKGLTAEQAKRLQGSTREELAEDADALLESFKTEDKSPTGNLTERLRGGGDPTQEPEETAAQVADQVLGGF